MPRLFAVLILLVAPLHRLSARTYQEVPELGALFKEKSVAGTFVLFDVAADTMFVSNEARAKKRFTPASTFKIANSLIGLDVGAVKSVDEERTRCNGRKRERGLKVRATYQAASLSYEEARHQRPTGMPWASRKQFVTQACCLSRRTDILSALPIERENNVYPFALNIDMINDTDAAKRIPLGRACLKVLGKL